MTDKEPFFSGEQPVDVDQGFFTEDTATTPILGEDLANRLAGTLSVIEGSDDTTTRFEQIKKGVLINTDTSPLEEFKKKYFRESDALTMEALDAYLRDPTKTPEDKASFVETVAEERANLTGKPDVNKAFLEMQATSALTRTVQDKVAQTALISNIEEINLANRKANEIFSQLNEDIDLRKLGTVADAAEFALIPGFGFRMNNMLNESMPGLSAELSKSSGFDIGSLHIPSLTDVSAGFLPGEMLNLWKEKMRTGTPTFRLQVAERMKQALQNHSGSLQDENELEAWVQLMDTLGNLNPTDDEVQLDRWLNNVSGLADLVFLGSLIEGTKRLVGRVRAGSVGRMMADTNPRAALNFFTEAITDQSENLAKSAGTTRTEIMQTYLLPKPKGVRPTAGPDIAPEIVAKGHEIFDNVSRSTLNFYDTEIQHAADRTIRTIEDTIEATPRLHLSKSIVESGPEGGYIAKVTVGASPDRGFTTRAQAEDAARGYSEADDGFEILHREFTTSELLDDEAGIANAAQTREAADTLSRKIDEQFKLLEDPKKLAKEADANGISVEEFQARLEAAVDADVARLNKLDEQILFDGEKGGDIIPAPTGEYFIQFGQEVVPTKLDVGVFEPNSVTGVTGGAAKYFDPNSRLSDFIVNASTRAVDKEAAVRNQFGQVIADFSNINARRQADVLYALEQSGQERRWMDLDELMERFNGDVKTVKGYIAAHNHEDMLWVVNNERLRKELIDQDMKHLKSQDFDTFATALTPKDAEDLVKAYYDPVQKVIIEVKKDDIAQIYEEGMSFAKMRGDEQVGNHRTDFVLVAADQGTTLAEVPDYVLRYIPGYTTVVHDTAHLVKKKLTNIKRNGEVIPGDVAEGLARGEMLQTHATAANLAEANRAARALNSNAEEGIEYVVVEARELRDRRYADQLDIDSMRDAGRLFFSRRSANVKSVTGKNVLMNIQDSMKQAASATARHLSFDEYSGAFRTRWEHQYGQFSKNGTFPASPEDFKQRPKAVAEQKDYDDAVAVADYINIVEGADNSYTSALTKKSMLWVANKITGTGDGPYNTVQKIREFSGEQVLKLAKKPDTLINIPKGVAFIEFLAFSPLRQLWMQASQVTIYTGIDHGFKFMMTPGNTGFAHQMGAMGTGLLSIDHPKLWEAVAPKAAASMDMSLADYRQFVLNFRRTGLNNVSSNEYASVMTLDPRTAVATGGNKMVEKILQVGATGVRGAAAVTRAARDIGFGLGEMTNIQAAYMVAMNRYLKNNPGATLVGIQKNSDIIDLIAADARQLAFNMARAGNGAQSKGALSLLLQFTAHQQKSLQAVLPTEFRGKPIPGISKVANKKFKQREKNRILLGQMLIGGTSALGINGVYEAARDEAGIVVPDEVDDIIRGGLQDLMLNAALNGIADTEGDVSFSRTMSPLSGAPAGNPAVKLFNLIMDTDASILDVIPGVAAGSNIWTAIEMAKDIYSVRELPTGQKLLLQLDAMARIMPQYNNFMKAKFALKTGQMSSATGTPLAGVTTSEILARGLIGTPSEKEVQINDILYGGKHFGKGSKEIDKELRDIAFQSYKFHKTLAFRLGQGEIDQDRVRELMRDDGYLLKFSLNSTELETVNRIKWGLYIEDQDKNGETKLTELFTNLLTKGFISTSDPIITQLKNAEEFEGKQELIGIVQDIVDLKSSLDVEED